MSRTSHVVVIVLFLLLANSLGGTSTVRAQGSPGLQPVPPASDVILLISLISLIELL